MEMLLDRQIVDTVMYQVVIQTSDRRSDNLKFLGYMGTESAMDKSAA